MRLWEGRLKTAVVVAPILFLMVAYSPPVLFFFLVALGIALAQYEFYRFYFPQQAYLPLAMGIALGFLVSYGFYGLSATAVFRQLDGLVAVVVLSALTFQLFSHRDIRETLVVSSVVLLGVFYIGWLLGHLIWLRGLTGGRSLLFFLLLVTWSGDAGAYYVGRAAGKRRLYPSVSPNKTVEGALGGWLTSVCVALISKPLFLPFLTVGDVLFLGMILGIAGQVGDLVESMFKRSAGIKDSGRLIPSHGGILDKVDSLAFNAPVLVYYLKWMKGYGPFIGII